MAKETKMEQKEQKSILTVTELKQKQTVLDLDTMTDAEILVVTKKYSIDDKAPIAEQLKVAGTLVTPDSEKVRAFLSYATSKSYQDSKNAALAKGNYLSQQLRSAIVGILANYPAMSDLKSSEIFDRWLTGFKAKKPSAVKILEQAQAAQAGAELDF